MGGFLDGWGDSKSLQSAVHSPRSGVGSPEAGLHTQYPPMVLPRMFLPGMFLRLDL
jgi:hypothetical protein